VHRRRWRSLGLALAFIAASATGARAAHGVVDLSWGTCSPVVTDIASPSGEPLSLVASQVGNDETHNAYQVWFEIAGAGDDLPDAWRFDEGGCRDGAGYSINHLPPAALAKACPAFQGKAFSLQIKRYRIVPDEMGRPTPRAQGFLACTYPDGATSDPAQRTFLAEFQFDHAATAADSTTAAVECAGAASPMVIRLLAGPRPLGQTTSYLRKGDGAEFTFGAGNTVVTVNGGPFGSSKAGARRKHATYR
jgi:hypothetical protein